MRISDWSSDVCSSDLDASFAGQQETFLNVVGIDDVLEKIRHVFASLYNDRAISYRVHKGYAHADVALSAGIQRMVRSDRGSAGVMRSEEHTSELQSLMRISYAVFCLNKKNIINSPPHNTNSKSTTT